MPSVFDSRGNHCGLNKVYRSSRHVNGRTTYYMNTHFNATGERQAKFGGATTFEFGVKGRLLFCRCAAPRPRSAVARSRLRKLTRSRWAAPPPPSSLPPARRSARPALQIYRT